MHCSELICPVGAPLLGVDEGDQVKEMNINMITKIAKKDFEVEEFVQLVISDENARDEIIHQMLTNPKIMVYYHCYYVVDKASQKQPELFYPYWTEIAALYVNSLIPV